MMFIRRGIIKWCVRAPRPKHGAGEPNNNNSHTNWLSGMTSSPEAAAGARWVGGGEVTFCG